MWNVKLTAIGILILATGALAGFYATLALGGSGTTGKFSFKHGKTLIMVDMTQGEISTENLFNKYLFSDKIRSTTTFALLRTKGIFSKNDPKLMNEYRNFSPSDPVAAAMRKLLINEEGPFVRSAHKYYNITDVRIVDGLNRLGKQNPAARKIIDTCFMNKGFCREDAIKIRVTVSPPNSVPRGNAAVCRDWEGYYSHNLSLLSANKGVLKRLTAANYFRCQDPETGRYEKTDKLPLIQINREDALELFGEAIIKKGFLQATLDRARFGTKLLEISLETRISDKSNEIIQ